MSAGNYIANAALRALHDCGVIRTRFDHEGMFALYDREMADCRCVEGDENGLDWFLTPKGKTLAGCMFS